MRICKGFCLALLGLMLLQPSVATADHAHCGQPLTDGSSPKASDALGVLRAAVGALACERCVRDVNRSGSTTAADGLLTLKKAVGQPLTLRCVDCLATATIGPTGGTITSHDGRLVIEVPPGALDAPTEMTIDGAAPSRLPASFEGTDIFEVYDLGPDGLTFEPPLAVTFHLPSETFSTDEDSITFNYPMMLTTADGEPEELEDAEAFHDFATDTAELRGNLAHFSDLIIFNPGGGPFKLAVLGFPSERTVGDGAFDSNLIVFSEVEIPKPVAITFCATTADAEDFDICEPCGLETKPVTADAFMMSGGSWVAPLEAECVSQGFCVVRFGAWIVQNTTANTAATGGEGAATSSRATVRPRTLTAERTAAPASRTSRCRWPPPATTRRSIRA